MNDAVNLYKEIVLKVNNFIAKNSKQTNHSWSFYEKEIEEKVNYNKYNNISIETRYITDEQNITDEQINKKNNLMNVIFFKIKEMSATKE